MKKSLLILSFAFLAFASVTFVSCKNAPKPAETSTEATETTETTEQVAAVAAFQCPMKCEGEKTYPEMGKCPTCGMDLKELVAAPAKNDSVQ